MNNPSGSQLQKSALGRSSLRLSSRSFQPPSKKPATTPAASIDNSAASKTMTSGTSEGGSVSTTTSLMASTSLKKSTLNVGAKPFTMNRSSKPFVPKGSAKPKVVTNNEVSSSQINDKSEGYAQAPKIDEKKEDVEAMHEEKTQDSVSEKDQKVTVSEEQKIETDEALDVSEMHSKQFVISLMCLKPYVCLSDLFNWINLLIHF